MVTPAPSPRGLHGFAILVAVATLGLILAGALVTSTESGLAVPDWPLSYGMIMPPMVGGIFYEHGHRMIATAVGFLTLCLAVWMILAEPRRWVRWLAIGALAAVVAQGLLGALTVKYLLPVAVSAAHGTLAQLFFCTTVALAVVTSPRWRAAEGAPAGVALHGPGLGRLGWAAPLFVLGQLILGVIMRHTDAALAIADFPLMHGGLWPRMGEPGVPIHFAHRLFAVPVSIVVCAAALRALRRYPADRAVRGAGRALLGLIALQLTLGALTVLTRRAVTPSALHVATGALLLGTSTLLTLLTTRANPTTPAPGSPPPARRDATTPSAQRADLEEAAT